MGFFESALMSMNKRNTPALNEFEKNDYDGEWLQVNKFLSMLRLDVA